MTEAMLSMRELRALFGTDTPSKIKLERVFAATHKRRLELVEDSIDWISQEITKNKHIYCSQGEDDISIAIVNMLRAMGYKAYHDPQYGGHCDIVIEERDDFLWIAEAKIHSSYDWLLKGFQQLDTRYSTGLSGQNSGEMLIYCNVARADIVMEKWTEHLKEQRPDVNIDICAKDSLARRSVHTHEATGASFFVRHKPISIYFNPKDK